jgi:hypothetical protein
MTIVILLICFVLIFFNLGILARTRVEIKEILLKSVLIFSVLTVFITEITSSLHLLKFQFVFLFWIGACIFSVLFLLSKKDKLLPFITILKQDVKNNFCSLNKLEKYLIFSIVAILVLVFIQGVIYPPNNWDSMTYHLARIINWISNQSVEHYPTHIFRQIYQPPLSEFIILHFNILNCGDYFSNSVQFFFLVFSSFAVVSMVEIIGLNRKYKLIAIVLLFTIPEVILQASSTQNDVVVSFFILTSIYFSVKSINELNFQNYFFLGLSIGLGILTKATAYIYLFPVIFILVIVVLIKLCRTKNYTYLRYSIIAALICVSVNSGHYTRNYKLSNNILGVDNIESKMYSNENMSPILLLLNIIKNAGLHIGQYPINKLSYKVIYKLHLITGVNIDNRETNFGNTIYSGVTTIPNHEDTAPNLIHFFLAVLSFILISINVLQNKIKYSKIALYFATILLLQMILFCLYLKWQPWGTRLHTPLFMLSIPLICYAINLNNIYIKILYKLIHIIVFYAFLIVLFNNSRPFLSNSYTARISITDNRYKKYFANRPNLYDEYNAIVENVKKSNYKNIGLILGTDDWEYPLFCQFYGKGVNPIHINVSNISKDISLNLNNIDCIISTTLNDTKIDFNEKNFYNQNINNNVIWLYK